MDTPRKAQIREAYRRMTIQAKYDMIMGIKRYDQAKPGLEETAPPYPTIDKMEQIINGE